MGKFKPGQKKRGGRKPGSKNKTTQAVKAALVEAFDQMGGVTSLVAWGKKNRGEFYKLWAKLLPVELKNADEQPFRFAIGDEVRKRLEDVDGGGPARPSAA